MMKLISCHIENFGKLNGKDYDFTHNISEFCENNGYGKTSLASFLKAMFYGLPSFTSRTKTFDDRQHFYPFSGGKFGGSVTFEKEGKTYKIERYFDKKSEVKDEVRVFCNGSVTGEFGTDIGRSIFGLDEASFIRTVFITADETDIASTSGINAKLNNYVDDTNEDNNFDTAIAALRSARKNLKAEKGAGGSISRNKEEIYVLRSEISNLKTINDGLNAVYESREHLAANIRLLEEQEAKAYGESVVFQQWDTYDSLLNDAAAENERLRALSEKYPSGIPDESEIAELAASLKERLAAESVLEATVFEGEKEARLNELLKTFGGGTPSESELTEVRAAIECISVTDTEIYRLESEKKTATAKIQSCAFTRHVPNLHETEAVQKLVEEYKQKEERFKLLPVVLTSAQSGAAVSGSNSAKNAKLPYIMALIAILLVATGIGMLFVQTAVGIAIIAVGAVALIAAVFVYFTKKFNGMANVHPLQINGEAAQLQTECERLKEKIRAFLVPYGYYTDNGVVYDFAAFTKDLSEFYAASAETEERDKLLTEANRKREELEKAVSKFLNGYGKVGENLYKSLNELQTDLRDFISLSNEQAAFQSKRGALKAQKQGNLKSVSAILNKYGIAAKENLSEQVKELETDGKELDRLVKSVKTLNKKAEEYKSEKNLTSRPERSFKEAEKITLELNSNRAELAALDRRIAEDEAEVEKLAEKTNLLELAEEKSEQLKERYELLSATMEALQSAEQKLKDKYIAPIKEKFLYYSNAIEKVLGERISMDKDFRVSFERGGENRSDKHLSAGQRSICALCLRLALIDNMYEKEKPFLIMDDPFVYLDEEHMSKTSSIVNTLAEDKQIIYFCCHESRKLGSKNNVKNR